MLNELFFIKELFAFCEGICAYSKRFAVFCDNALI